MSRVPTVRVTSLGSVFWVGLNTREGSQPHDPRDPQPERFLGGPGVADVPPCSCVLLILGFFCTLARKVSLGEALTSRGGLLGIQHQAPEPLPSAFWLVPPATLSRISRDS